MAKATANGPGKGGGRKGIAKKVNEMTAGEVEEDEEEQEDLDLTGCICPKCGDGEGLREILYGLMGLVDEDKFIVGGCCVDDDSPYVGCVKCGWRGSAPHPSNI